MLAAVQALRESEPAQIVIAVPAAPESTWREFAGLVDNVVCASMPHPFLAVGESYWDFSQVSDDEVRELLATPTTPAPSTDVMESPADQVRRVAVDAPDGVPSLRVLDKLIGDARVALIGESSHGTHDFYQARAEITKWLFHVRPAEQFDAMIHIDQTRALEPLELTSEWIAGELPETYPSGL